jgi:hypothetical protein
MYIDAVFVGGLLITAGIYALVMIQLHPDKFLPAVPRWLLRLLGAIAICGGLLTIFGDRLARLFGLS